jgi:integrase
VETGTRPRWLGGFIRETANGKPVYVIEKRISGALFKVSTRRHTEDAAMRELRRFEADPGGYDPTRTADTLTMTPELVMEHVDWQMTPRPAGRGNSRQWALECGNFLKGWLEALGGRDLRRVSSIDVKHLLKRWETSLPARVVAIKGFFSWLRKEKGLLKHHEDPMPDVRIPERHAAKETLTGARDVPFQRVQKVYRHLRKDVRDILLLLSGTGWHLSEVRRFATNGEIRKDPTGKHLATLVTFHKRKEKAVSGIMHREHLDAAKRLRAAGTMLSDSTLAGLMRKANRRAGIKPDERPVYFGDMRHNVSTWAIEAGEDIGVTAKAFNHTSEKMLRQHYVRHAVPRATIKTRVLKG